MNNERNILDEHLAHLYLRSVTSAATPQDLELSPSPRGNYQVFWTSLYTYGLSIELLTKFMIILKTDNARKVIQLSHKLPKILEQVDRLYVCDLQSRYRTFLDSYAQILQWLGRYPIPKAPQPAVTDLLELQRSTRPFWIELLNTVEAPLTENQRRDFGTAKQLALGTFEADWYPILVHRACPVLSVST
jgi:hypothetical protein